MVMFEAIEEIWTKVRDFNEYTRALVTFTTSIGAIVIIYYTIKITLKSIGAFRLYCLSQYHCPCSPDYTKKYGKWAVISGATDGIGLAMARNLARRGMSIIVIARNEEKMTNTKASLEQESNAGEIMTVKIDLSDSSLENFARIRSQIDPENRDIGILINNAGAFPTKFQRYNRFSMEELKNIVDLNILATLHLTRMIMPGMIERGRGVVVNVSSALGSLPTPYMSVYGATKKFVDAFSKQLQIEYASHPINIVNLTPGAVHTKLFIETANLPKPTLLNPSPDDYARVSLNALSTGIDEYSGTAFHGLGREVAAILNWLGLIPIIMRLNLKWHARNYQLSPVPKRKRLVQEDSTGPQGECEEAHENLSRN